MALVLLSIAPSKRLAIDNNISTIYITLQITWKCAFGQITLKNVHFWLLLKKFSLFQLFKTHWIKAEL